MKTNRRLCSVKSGLAPAVKNRAAHGSEDCAARRVKIKAHALTREARKPFGLRASWILAAIYSRGTYRPTTIDVLMFHFRVRNGTGWGHQAMTTRFQGALRCFARCLPR